MDSDARGGGLALTLMAGGLAAALAGCAGHGGPGSASGQSSTAAHAGRPAATASPSTSPSGPSSFTIAATGDLLIHLPVAAKAKAYGAAGGVGYDFRPMFAKVRPALSVADLAICHIETPLTADDKAVSGYPVFAAPGELAGAVAWAGYDSCSTASNHSIDGGASGVKATLDLLDRSGVAHTGTARSAPEARRIETHTVQGVRVAHLSYTYAINGVSAPGKPYLVNLTSVPAILQAAHRARQQGAQFVVVLMHWGAEYQSKPTALQRSQARALLASPDVDLIFGDHAHVLQPVEKIADKYVVYGLGNLLSNQSPAHRQPPQTQDGAIVTAHVVARGHRFVVDRVTYTPTFCQIGPYLVWPVRQALADPATPAALRAQLTASLRRTEAIESSLPGHQHDAVLAPPTGA